MLHHSHARVLALASVLAGCSHLPAAAVLTSSTAQSVGVTHFAQSAPSDAVVLLHGLGTNGRVWDLEDGARFAEGLWSSGLTVYVLDIPWGWLGDGGLAASQAAVREALRGLMREHPHARWYGVGHDLGGRALLEAVREGVPLQRVVVVGTPLSFGGATLAFRRLLEAPRRLGQRAVDWSSLLATPLVPSTAEDGSFQRLLLSVGWDEGLAAAFYARALQPMPASLLDDMAALVSSAVPSSGLAEILVDHAEVGVLVITAPSDGFAPPWQCDPAGLGVRFDHIERLYATRANGHGMEFNHLDLVLHPEAAREILPRVRAFLDEP